VGRALSVPGCPYSLFLVVARLRRAMTRELCQRRAMTFVANASLIKKVDFPRKSIAIMALPAFVWVEVQAATVKWTSDPHSDRDSRAQPVRARSLRTALIVLRRPEPRLNEPAQAQVPAGR
jgi:hypothetical protein